jgi:hypothetical protein
MADSIEPEFIPNSDLLFCRVHRTQFNSRENRIMRTVFEKPNQSVDWSKYSTPEQTIARHATPQVLRGVASIAAGKCRSLGQDVVHDPLGSETPGGRNDAHAEIRGQKSGEISSKLRDAAMANDFWDNPLFTQQIS